MFEKRINLPFVFLVLFLFGAFTASCAGQTPEVETLQPQQPVTDQLGAEIDVKHVEVRPADRIIFSGSTTLTEGECINSQLFKDNNPVGWWPSDKCFLIDNPDWQFAVILGEDDNPEKLDDSSQYRLQVWWAGDSDETIDDIYFDLAGPQSP